jgi:hypothetical protein
MSVRLDLVATTCVVALAAALLTSVPLAPERAAAATCVQYAGPFHAYHSAIYTSAGKRYIPYGLNVTGLARALSPTTVSSDEAVIQAAALSWCANTVRFQIAQDYLVSSSGTVDHTFLSAIESEVSYARSLGLMAVLNDQDQTGPDADAEYMPTHRTFAFWSSLAYHYSSDPGVIFDVFNEPRNVQTWDFWRNGGWRSGVRYYGMEDTARHIRNVAPDNLLWIEGPHTGGTLSEAWAYRLRYVGPLMYAVHRPRKPHTRASWDNSFGYLVARDLAPAVEGEWADYARAGAPWACWDDAPTSVPLFLRYLASLHIGMIVTRMTRGQLIESDNLDDPAHIRSNWSCTTGLGQGAGNQIHNWYIQHNKYLG